MNRKPGRPKLKNKKVSVQGYVEPWIAEFIKSKARKRNVSTSDMVEHMLRIAINHA